jgi:hypothetical protein
MQMYICLSNSLTDAAKKKITHELTNYQIGPNSTVSAACFLKVIIESARVATNATTAFIRANLAHLETYMTSVDSDITEFNNYVKTQVSDLGACGEASNDLLINLFSGYSSAADLTFVQYMRRKQELYEEGTVITTVELMNFAENKFKTMKQANQWRAPTKQDEEFVAMNVKIQSLESQNANLMRKRKPDMKPTNRGYPPAQRGNYNKKKPPPRNFGAKKPKQPRPPNQGKYAWKDVPIPGRTTLKRDGKNYNWCPYHKAWCIHNAAECSERPMVPAEAVNANHDHDRQETLQLAKAYTSRIKEEQGDYYDDE